MKYKEFINSLPSGLHDSDLLGININYTNHSIEMLVDVAMSTPENPDISNRKATILISNFQYLVIESPDSNYIFAENKPVWIDTGEMAELKRKPTLPTVADKYCTWWIYVKNWNSFIYLATEDIAIAWNKAL